MMPPADQIHLDPSQGARKVPSDTADLDFQAVSPALRILQLNVEGLSAAKRSNKPSAMFAGKKNKTLIKKTAKNSSPNYSFNM